MTAIEGLTLRVRETQRPVTQLHITAPTDLICQMIDDFEARGELPDFDDDVVRFGPHLAVFRCDDLPDNTFKIELRADCDLNAIRQ